MLKTSLVAAFLAIIPFSPAYAADLCNDAHMKQMDDMIAKMTDTAMQKQPTAALDMSKAAMKKGDTAECMKHMEEAHKAMGHMTCRCSGFELGRQPGSPRAFSAQFFQWRRRGSPMMNRRSAVRESDVRGWARKDSMSANNPGHRAENRDRNLVRCVPEADQ
jgi:hypothetical protein